MNRGARTAPPASALARVALAAGLGLGALRAAATEDLPGVSASMSRPAYPLLIGNPYAPLVRVIVNVGMEDPTDTFARYDLRLTSLGFTLDGCDDLGDLESLRLVTTGSEGELRQSRRHTPLKVKTGDSAVTELSGPNPPAASVVFHLDQPLRAGANVFWLSGRLRPSANLLHRIAATCSAVGTSAGWLTAPDETPGRRQRIGLALRRDGDDGVDTYAIPALTTSARGSLLCVYDMRWNYPGHDLQDRITTGLSRSADGGRTWEPMRTILDQGATGGLPPAENGCSDPGIVVDRQTGRIFVFAVWMHGKPGHHQWKGDGAAPGYEIGRTPQLLMVRSDDDGRTWSRPENLTRKLKQERWWLFTTAPQHGLQLADGTLAMPMEGRDEKGWFFSTVMISRDHGATWTVGAPVAGGGEPTLAQLGDGSLMLNMRNQRPDETFLYRLVSVSRDLGRTWQPHATDGNTLIEPNCNASLLRADYEEGGQARHVLLFANPHTREQWQRHHQTIQVSFDDGRMWPRDHDCLLDEGLGWGYPSLAQIDPHRIGIVYGGSQADLVFQEISLEELLHP